MTGDQLQRDIRIWLYPPDPSTNHNVACDTHRRGSSAWFTEGSTFEGWKSKGSFLWICGERMSSSNFNLFGVADYRRAPDHVAGSGKSGLWYVL